MIEGEVVSVQPEQNSFSMIRDFNIVVVIDPTQTEIKSEDGGSVSAGEFFTRLRPGSRVKAEGLRGVGTTLDAKSAKVALKSRDD